MEKMPHVYQKPSNKQPKNKKKQPLKVVYITNPKRFKTSASEFRALVQELTGQDAHTPEFSNFTVDDGAGGDAVEAAVAAEDNVHAVLEEEKIGNSNGEVEQEGSDPSTTGSYDVDDLFCPDMIEVCLALWAQT